MRIKTMAALLALPLLAACAPEVESSIYISDVVKVAETGEVVETPALLRIPQGSEDGCKDGLERLIENLKALAPVTGKAKCIEKEGDQLAEIETSMVIATPDAEVPQPNLFVLEVAPAAGAPTYALTFRLLKPLEEITKALAANSDEMNPEFDPAKFIFQIENDGAGSIALSPNHIFVDGAPGLPDMGDPIAIARRGSVEIVFSDVASVHVAAANGYRFATINAAE